MHREALEFALDGFELVAVQNVGFCLVTPDEGHFSCVASVTHIAEHAEHGGDPDPTGNHDELPC